MEIKIEKNVPMPSIKKTTAYGTYIDLLSKMEPGDSFAVEGNVVSLNSAIRQSAKRLGMKITAHKEADDKLRVWLVSKSEPKS